MALQAGDAFGRYELVSWLGRGGMAEAWRAKLVGAAGVTMSVLIKKVLPEYADDEAFLSMFISEAQISASLSHGNVAQVFDFGQVDGEYFLAMEFVDGRPLDKVLKRALRGGLTALPVPAAVFIVMEMCRGLHYAHTRTDGSGRPLGIVHRDISPDNVLVSYEGQVKIVDFGIAKAQLQRGVRTEPGVVKGKYLFFSPEQARGEEVDARTDVWATGIVLYELLCAKLPVEGPPHTVMMKLAEGKLLPSPRTLRPQLPKALNDIVMKALAPDREQRFESSHAFGDALAEYLYANHPRCSALSLANLLRVLFRQDLAQEGRDLKVARTFQDEVKTWGEPELEKLASAPTVDPLKTRRVVRAVTLAPRPETATTETHVPPTVAPGPSRWWRYGAGAGGVLAAVAGLVHLMFTVPPAPPDPVPTPVAVAPRTVTPAQEPKPEPVAKAAPLEAASSSVPQVAERPPEAPRPTTRKATSRASRTPPPAAVAVAEAPAAPPTPIAEPVVTTASAAPEPTPVEEPDAPAEEPKKGVLGFFDTKRQQVQQKVSAVVKTRQQELQQKVSGLMQSNQYESALQAANDCVEDNPSNPDCHLMLGNIHARMKHPRESTQHYERFLSLAPTDHPKRAQVAELVAKAKAPSATNAPQ